MGLASGASGWIREWLISTAPSATSPLAKLRDLAAEKVRFEGDTMTDSNLPSREEAMGLLKEFNQSDRALKHALAVEAVMRGMARRRGADVDKWGLVGLIHDLDYERFGEQHCQKTREILTERGWDGEIVRAVVSHGWGICCDVQPTSEMEKALYAVDELTGLVSAAALVRPSRSIMDLKVKSVKKKWKEKGFAAGVNREVISRGAEMLGMELADLIVETIEGMSQVADEIGLAGAPGGPGKGAEQAC